MILQTLNPLAVDEKSSGRQSVVDAPMLNLSLSLLVYLPFRAFPPARVGLVGRACGDMLRPWKRSAVLRRPGLVCLYWLLWPVFADGHLNTHTVQGKKYSQVCR
ncbi:Uncharacterized protein HZ326_22959 [Fusarium oxysporum f. sp. albedinis]|nr:Uncharacterized protein HZ326_22959 [Fusarium oxysporum f. sp. albedinis]